jgi:hypothetical protein
MTWLSPGNQVSRQGERHEMKFTPSPLQRYANMKWTVQTASWHVVPAVYSLHIPAPSQTPV